jgi:hypothetical protein
MRRISDSPRRRENDLKQHRRLDPNRRSSRSIRILVMLLRGVI